MARTISRYGWIPSLPDVRDLHLQFGDDAAVASSVDLRTSGFLPSIWDQGQLGSCTAHAAPAAYSYDLAKQGGDSNFEPSRLFVYYNTRVIEGTADQDSGATIADAIKSLNAYGCPPESDWSYDISLFTAKPPTQAYDDGKLREAVRYARVAQTVNAMQACLTAGLPIVVGFTVYQSFESQSVADTGRVPLPGPSESVLGGHAVLVVGYESDGTWICRNSWGTGWGDNGYFYMPQSYLTNSQLADDFWTVQAVSSPSPVPPTPQPTPTPTPTPDPVPTPVDVDAELWVQLAQWANARHTRTNKLAAQAVKLWAIAKGLTN